MSRAAAAGTQHDVDGQENARFAPLVVPSADAVAWNDSADVVVVGFGLAGACTALSAREHGADVIVVDRFDGGGASALSGGVYYGGGTRFQREAGYDDTPEEMFKYLTLEVSDAVLPSTLRRFCEDSAPNLEWLINHGARFSGNLSQDTEAYMTPGRFLYFSGNERVPEYAAVAKPAPRGHIAVGDGGGSMGQYLYAALKRSALGQGVKFYAHSPVTRLVTAADGSVLGIEVRHLGEGSVARALHRLAAWAFHLGKGMLYGPVANVLARMIERAERSGSSLLIRARRGVVLSAGSFTNNRLMVARYAPRHVHGIPMGSAGCTGDGINLGLAAGASTRRMDWVESGRSFLLPPSFLKGVLVDSDGKRWVSENAYKARIGKDILQDHGGRAWLILDNQLFWDAVRTVMPWKKLIFRYRIRSLMPLLFAWRRSATLEGLAPKCGINAANLKETIDRYNRMARSGAPDPLGKAAALVRPLKDGPYYAINSGTDSRGFPPMIATQGGLRVDEASGEVLRDDGSVIRGLYAAGRTTVGIPSNFYISGLSLADCVFSGRRAGAAAATGQRLTPIALEPEQSHTDYDYARSLRHTTN